VKHYRDCLTASVNSKGVLDIDPVKGCSHGMANYPDGGCYGLCYANKIATFYGYNFNNSVSRDISKSTGVVSFLKKHRLPFFRMGTMGDPCHDWPLTLQLSEWLYTIRIPVIVTKHWEVIKDDDLKRLRKCNAIVNTSVSPLDTPEEIKHRLDQYNRIKFHGINSVLRIVSCKFGKTETGIRLNDIQNELFKNQNIIDTPLRIPKTDYRVICGDILIDNNISVFNKKTHLGECFDCEEQCGVVFFKYPKQKKEIRMEPKQMVLKGTEPKVEFIPVESVIGSGYEEDVAVLAIEDKVAYRAARKNMQIHSAIILKINDEFSGFFTFQVNHEAKEFCLLQSAMKAGREDKAIYSDMLQQIINQNTFGYPMVMTVSTKHKLECPKVLEGVGFQTYLMLSGFAYMVYGTLDQVRMKRLAHATMTNAWTTTRSDWLKMKREWNGKIEEAGEKHDIPNPKFASRDGCWQGSNGYSNVVLSSKAVEDGKVVHKKGKSFNGNASVLDPLACEVILRFFMPTDGKRVYNPFGGGVQMGFVTGSYGYEYIASEIRKNQCDANNAICQDLDSAKWIQSDSSTYSPKGKFDLMFSCPPYYKVEKYIDYEGVIPEGELNNLPTYDEFRDILFAGYKKALESLNDNCFFVIMTGDSRDKNGAYYGCEAEHELFFKDQGLHIYNKITYLECEFTRLAHAKRTLDYRKFPKREQKILVFYKGDMKKIKDLYPKIGRL
jgi:hypothetical protein